MMVRPTPEAGDGGKYPRRDAMPQNGYQGTEVVRNFLVGTQCCLA